VPHAAKTAEAAEAAQTRWEPGRAAAAGLAVRVEPVAGERTRKGAAGGVAPVEGGCRSGRRSVAAAAKEACIVHGVGGRSRGSGGSGRLGARAAAAKQTRCGRIRCR
jgi:hypothetical protein